MLPGAGALSFAFVFARWRDRLLANPALQRRLMALPPVRWVARRQLRSLFDLCAGFVYSQVLAACVELGLFSRLAGGPRAVNEILAGNPHGADLSPEALITLLDAAVALRLLRREHRDGVAHYGLGAHGAVIAGDPGLVAMIRHHRLLYRDLTDPLACLRTPPGGLARYWAYADGDDTGRLQPERVAEYTALMAESQTLVAQTVLAAYPLTRHRAVLDVGGGSGVFLATVAAGDRPPALHLFDLPPVAALARERLAARLPNGVRVGVHGGDFLRDALPAVADLITLVRIAHDHDDAPLAQLLAAAFRALPPGGRLLLAEPMAGTRGGERIADAYFGVYLRAMGSGRPRTRAELTGLLSGAGFVRVRERPSRLPELVRVLIAERPSTVKNT